MCLALVNPTQISACLTMLHAYILPVLWISFWIYICFHLAHYICLLLLSCLCTSVVEQDWEYFTLWTKYYYLSWLGKLAKSLFIFLFFSFLIYNYKMERGKYHVTLSQWWRMVTDGHVTSHSCHMTRVTWGPWENKRIATVVKCISSRELSENPIEFSLSNSEQRDSWLNSGHRTLDADITQYSYSVILSL